MKILNKFLIGLCLVLSVNAMVYGAAGTTLKSDKKETWGWRTAMMSSLLLSLASNPFHASEYSVTLMNSESDVSGFKVGFRWFPENKMAFLEGTNFKHYYHVAYNYWQSLTIHGQEGVNNVVELSPIFRYNFNERDWLSYVETSVGISFFSRSELNERQFSTHFQFANMLAIGGYITNDASWNLQLQHYSNNSIKLPNNGINFYNFGFSYRY